MSNAEESYSLEEEAEILASIGTHSPKRKKSILDVAKYLQYKLHQQGADVDWVAQTVGFKDSSLVPKFLACLRLPPTVQDLVGWEGSREGKFGLFSASEISKLDNVEDMDAVAKATAELHLTKQQVIDIVQLRKRNAQIPILDCIKQIKKLGEVTITKGYAVVTSFTKQTHQNLQNKAKSEGVTIESLISRALESSFPKDSITSVSFRKGFLYLVLTELGFERFRQLPQELNTTKEEVVEELIKRGGKGSGQ